MVGAFCEPVIGIYAFQPLFFIEVMIALLTLLASFCTDSGVS